ncbi:MAG TPA: hypothetical protein VHH73_01610 [Verrucomicrobiae bacterium]|nr:hypothetical protein [Verrucomicrobiae bacterium]
MMTTMPHKATVLMALASALVEWLPADAESLLWISNWQAEQIESFTLFHAARRGHAEPRALMEAPGHLVDLNSQTDRQIAAGLIFLVMAFGWEGYFASKQRGGFIYFGDEHLVFTTRNARQLRQVTDYVAQFHLQLIDDIRQAWDV